MKHEAPALHVAMVSEHASPLAALGGPDAGGQNVYVAQLARHLVRRGHEVTVYTRRDDPALPHTVTTKDGFKVVHVPAGPPAPVPKDELPAHMPEFGRYLARSWAAAPPDLVHAHFWMSGTAALAGAREHGVPVVQTYHALGTVKRRYQGSEDTSPPERIETEARIGRSCNRILATCSDEVGELLAMGIDRRHVRVVPCGVDTEHFAPVPDARRTEGPKRLLAVGRLVPRKGFDRAIRALAGVPDAELLIAGGPEEPLLFDDPEAVRLRKVAEEHGVSERVRLLGAVSHGEMPALMSSADLVLSLPRYEPFGIVPIEAMACRTPVVATAVGGHLDTVVDGVTGVLVPPVDDHGLDRVIRDLLADPELLARLGAAGRERALDRYTWERVAEGVAAVYDGLLSVPELSGVAR
ncbi:glycosyl transferase [Streptomyces sp. Ru73]|uniref:glycosyltransferase n=1 Tax=Streptomyces sp. Ru73 TaxID=2080748 RepID=UPI000CDE412C|nr:glycosyltransferase [Streptomyces sp. Ru73]POX39360.1 glycosyl transferase [Streptomyces sp. Ru73]